MILFLICNLIYFIEDTGTIMNKEECYKVIDECMDETPETAEEENSQAEVTSPKSDSTTQQDPTTDTANTDAGKI